MTRLDNPRCIRVCNQEAAVFYCTIQIKHCLNDGYFLSVLNLWSNELTCLYMIIIIVVVIIVSSSSSSSLHRHHFNLLTGLFTIQIYTLYVTLSVNQIFLACAVKMRNRIQK